MVVILQVFYFKWLPPECIKVERRHLIARSMEVNTSVACKRLMKERQLLFQVFWNGENSGLMAAVRLYQKCSNVKTVLNIISHSLSSHSPLLKAMVV